MRPRSLSSLQTSLSRCQPEPSFTRPLSRPASRLHLPCGRTVLPASAWLEVVSAALTGGARRPTFDEALAGERLVTACSTRVRDDLVIRIRDTHDAAMRVVGNSRLLINARYLPIEAASRRGGRSSGSSCRRHPSSALQ